MARPLRLDGSGGARNETRRNVEIRFDVTEKQREIASKVVERRIEAPPTMFVRQAR